MSRTIHISKNYRDIIPGFRCGNLRNKGYTLSREGKTSSNRDLFITQKLLYPEFDIFSALTEGDINNERVSRFLSKMKSCILEYNTNDLRGVVFPKLIISEKTDTSIVIEWIFNYFRFCFSFDDKEGDYYGFVINDMINGEFSSDFIKMNQEEYSSIASNVVSKAIELVEGNI